MFLLRCSEAAVVNQVARHLLNGLVERRFAFQGASGDPGKVGRSWPAKVSGGVMSEVVVLIGAEESRDPSRLMSALDAFAKWAAESGFSGEAGDAPEIMMKSEFNDGEMRRKLVFQDRDHAARFLFFWRSERQRSRVPDSQGLSL